LEGGGGLGVVGDAPDCQFKGTLAGVAAAREDRGEAVLVGEGAGGEGLAGCAVAPEAIEDVQRRVGVAKHIRLERELQAAAGDEVQGSFGEEFVAGGGEADFGGVSLGEERGDAARVPAEEDGLPTAVVIIEPGEVKRLVAAEKLPGLVG